MKQIRETIEVELIIEKSKFLTFLVPVNDIDDVNYHLKEIRKSHPSATHHCYAYLLDNQNIQRSNDDGEPKGTAGIPILESLKQHNLTNTLAVVVRYFGGVLLGKGGLIRAYKNSTLKAIKKASFFKETLKEIYEFTLPYSLYDTLKHYLKDKANIISEEFLENIIIKLYFTKGNINKLKIKFGNEIIIKQLQSQIIKIDY